ncbi:MAG: NAD-dependent epimerase/dehydratase family protein [Nanoarchaeota archaeon]|nr:NAD-dependent epimerase/dehydratase family protein [Nanoarchaeota archaeon]
MSHIIQEDLKLIANNINDLAQKLSGKTFLITGGAGFLGNYFIGLIDYLNNNVLKEPCKIISIDNFITGVKYRIPEGPHFTAIKHDIRAPINIEGPVDFILHAAGIASPKFYRDHKIQTIDVATLGTRNMLELAKEKKTESMIFFSSSEIYGDPHPEFVPTPETYRGNVSCTGPRANYDESKRLGETYCIAYYESFNIPVKIVRPFNIYGPGMRLDDFRVLPNFATHHLTGKALPVYGDGNQTRTFCYVSDAITAIMRVLLNNHNGEAFNIGADEPEISIGGIAQMMHELYGTELQYIKRETMGDAYDGKADPHRRCPDLTKTKTKTGYQPQVDLKTGIQRFMIWATEVHSQKNIA